MTVVAAIRRVADRLASMNSIRPRTRSRWQGSSRSENRAFVLVADEQHDGAEREIRRVDRVLAVVACGLDGRFVDRGPYLGLGRSHHRLGRLFRRNVGWRLGGEIGRFRPGGVGRLVGCAVEHDLGWGLAADLGEFGRRGGVLSARVLAPGCSRTRCENHDGKEGEYGKQGNDRNTKAHDETLHSETRADEPDGSHPSRHVEQTLELSNDSVRGRVRDLGRLRQSGPRL